MPLIDSRSGYLRPAMMASLPCVVSMLLLTTPALAGQYEVVKGKGVDVCDAYEKALNAPPPNRVPASCRRIVPKDPRHPGEAKEFSQPQWKEINKWKNEALLREIWEYEFSRNVNPVHYFAVNRWNDWRGTPEQYAIAHQFFIGNQEDAWGVPQYIAEFDIDNDGVREPIYLDRNCTGMTGGHALFVVLTTDGKNIDREKTERTQARQPFAARGRHVFRSAVKGLWGDSPTDVERGSAPVEDAWGWAAYDFFFYRGKTYYDLWWSRRPDYHGKPDSKVGRLRVFITERDKKAREVCTYRYYDDAS